nr:hypothetical protein [uncultured Actinoplanes sp.]
MDVAYTPMAQNHPVASEAGLVPVPVAVVLPPGSRRLFSAGRVVPDWHGVGAREVAGLISWLSVVGDLVVEVDGHPTVQRAADHLGRRFTAPACRCRSAQPASDDRPSSHSRLVRLIFAALPRPEVGPMDVHGIATDMYAWRSLLRAGGYLVTVLTSADCDVEGTARAGSLRATVIAAARAAEFSWQQEFLVLTAPLPDVEPRARHDEPADLPAALVDGRHRRAHRKVLAFRNDGGASDA